MAVTRRTRTGIPLEMPSVPPKQKAIFLNGRKDCVDHSPQYNGNVPVSGDLECLFCGTVWEPVFGKLIKIGDGGNNGSA